MMYAPKLIIFDCDGVLVDSEIIAGRISAEVLSALGYAISTEDSIRKFTGMSFKSFQSYLKEEAGLDLTEELYHLRINSLIDTFEKELRPLIFDVLDCSHTWQALHRCIASNNHKDRILKSLAITRQDHFFDEQHVFTAAQVERAKPFPDLFLMAADTMKVKPQDCLVIEDSSAGIEAALEAKMQVVGFLGGTHTAYDWYKRKIQKFNIPLAFDAEELRSYIRAFAAA